MVFLHPQQRRNALVATRPTLVMGQCGEKIEQVSEASKAQWELYKTKQAALAVQMAKDRAARNVSEVCMARVRRGTWAP